MTEHSSDWFRSPLATVTAVHLIELHNLVPMAKKGKPDPNHWEPAQGFPTCFRGEPAARLHLICL
jgi:hypothetical protein